MVPSLFRFLIRFLFSFSLPLCSDFLADFWWRHTQLWCTDSRPSWWWQTLFWPHLSGCWAQRHASDDNYRRVWDSCNSSKPSPSRPQLQPQLRPFSSRYGRFIIIASSYIFFFKRLQFLLQWRAFFDEGALHWPTERSLLSNCTFYLPRHYHASRQTVQFDKNDSSVSHAFFTGLLESNWAN